MGVFSCSVFSLVGLVGFFEGWEVGGLSPRSLMMVCSELVFSPKKTLLA